MTLISAAALVALAFIFHNVRQIINGSGASPGKLKNIPIAGSAAFMLGLLAQVIGLYQAMNAIQQAGDVSPALLAGGFKVSLIAPIYGLIIFVITLLVYLGISTWHSSLDQPQAS